jgi:hypothetical protein
VGGEVSLELLQEALHWHKYALAIYGTVMFLWSKRHRWGRQERGRWAWARRTHNAPLLVSGYVHMQSKHTVLVISCSNWLWRSQQSCI